LINTKKTYNTTQKKTKKMSNTEPTRKREGVINSSEIDNNV
jgi:hypothetical protein